MTARWVDPVVEEVRARGHAYTERFRHDIHAIAEDLRADQRENPDRCTSPTMPVEPSRPDTEGPKFQCDESQFR